MKQNFNSNQMDTEMQTNQTNKGCCRVVMDEIHCPKYKFNHEPMSDFFKSQWQKGDTSIAFLIYRWFFASWFTACMSISIKDLFVNGKWFIYFTNWGYALTTLMSIYSAILVSLYYCNPHKMCIPSWAVKLFWCMHLSALVCATGLSFIYWIFIYPFSNFKIPEGVNNPEILRMYTYFFNERNDRSCLLYFHNISAHALNSVMMVLDQMLVAFPTRLLHCIYPAIFALIYAGFTIVYHLAGGLNVIGRPYIYRIVNWGENPLFATFTVVGCVSVVVPMSFLAFMLYRIRNSLYKRKQIREIRDRTQAPTVAV